MNRVQRGLEDSGIFAMASNSETLSIVTSRIARGGGREASVITVLIAGVVPLTPPLSLFSAHLPSHPPCDMLLEDRAGVEREEEILEERVESRATNL